jgi:hypothetical protein
MFQAWASDDVSVHTQRDRETGAFYSTIYTKGGSRLTSSRREILRALNLPAGTPSGDALRRYLDWWYAPPTAQEQPTTPPNTP